MLLFLSELYCTMSIFHVFRYNSHLMRMHGISSCSVEGKNLLRNVERFCFEVEPQNTSDVAKFTQHPTSIVDITTIASQECTNFLDINININNPPPDRQKLEQDLISFDFGLDSTPVGDHTELIVPFSQEREKSPESTKDKPLNEIIKMFDENI